MRHFLFEFITGGGLAGQPLPDTLISEGELMMQTLLREVSELDNADISLCRDSRLGLYENVANQFVIEANVIRQLPGYLEESDVCWLIAPETETCLEDYARLFNKYGHLFIGSSEEAIRLTSSKYQTNKKLMENNVHVVETKWLNEPISESDVGWVVKPDDGVGAENLSLIKDKEKIKQLKDSNDKKIIVQPYINGNHMSMSLLVFNDDVCLIACNKQYVDIKNNAIKLTEIGVNECLGFKDKMLELALKIVKSIPGLKGYIGVDLIEVDGELFVLEINPRFTTAYAGISKSLGCNITAIILDTFLNKKLPEIKLDSALPVTVVL
jgi:tyramine---L-glutamate ligase